MERSSFDPQRIDTRQDDRTPTSSHHSVLISKIYGGYLESLTESDPMTYIPLAWRTPGQQRMHTEFYSSAYEAVCRVSDLRQMEVDAFFGIAPRRRRGPNPRLLKSAIPHVLTLHVDLDGKSLADERRLKRQRPTFVVKSGTDFHYHGYFVIDEPLLAKTHGPTAYELNKQLAKQLGGDLNAADISRILRVPGTLHMKNLSNPVPIEILEVNEFFSFDSLVERFGRHIQESSTDIVKRALNRKSSTSGSFVTPTERQFLDGLLRHGLTERHTREKATLVLIRDCFGKGMNAYEVEGFVINFFKHNHNNLSEDWLKRPDWCKANIKAKVRNWWPKAYATPSNAVVLTDNDLEFIDSKTSRKWERQFLRDALKFILSKMDQERTVFLSARTIRTFKGANSKNYKRRLDLLLKLGILELKERASKSKRLASVYYVLYEQQSVHTH